LSRRPARRKKWNLGSFFGYASHMPMAPLSIPPTALPENVMNAWAAYGDPRTIESAREMSAQVSTNSVFLIRLSDGHEVVAKTSSYGSYIHFRQDHRIIAQWIRRLAPTRFRGFLAPILQTPDGEVFTYQEDNTFVVFYQKASFYDFLPKVLTDGMIRSLATELGDFHAASAAVAPLLATSWNSLGSDVANLFDRLGAPEGFHGLPAGHPTLSELRRQCDLFFSNAEKLGYHQFPKMPVLMDWNIGNFSVGLLEDGFRFYSRWDYDWFRVEPRALDFYFCARVVRSEGDRTVFSYTVSPYFEDRFVTFLKAYHAVHPLVDEEVLFLKEAYRAFLLNYVVRSGEYFFREIYGRRLEDEAVSRYFPELEAADFSVLVRQLSQS
jgi:hypothetical protein